MPENPRYIRRDDVTAEQRAVLDQNEAAVREWVDCGVAAMRDHLTGHSEDDPPHEVWCSDDVIAAQIAALDHSDARMVVHYVLHRLAQQAD